ncbi:hypothetical protein OK016_03560 [Vibrio chagasii]|nr:hypothetical protein [Vibrio chagasii]
MICGSATAVMIFVGMLMASWWAVDFLVLSHQALKSIELKRNHHERYFLLLEQNEHWFKPCSAIRCDNHNCFTLPIVIPHRRKSYWHSQNITVT